MQRGTNTIWLSKKYCYSKYNKKDIFQNYKCKRRAAHVCVATNTLAQAVRTLPFGGLRLYISKYYLYVSYIIHDAECAFVYIAGWNPLESVRHVPLCWNGTFCIGVQVWTGQSQCFPHSLITALQSILWVSISVLRGCGRCFASQKIVYLGKWNGK